ncbi:hypothetical protein DMC64_36965 [Amycolatopsis sp. WAC 04197]|uniref:hypothetical protein n=1 Tax=Amycolatopsis sp. WAC 04197 TaxID=2203199 RepID=UPI000F79B9BD|nr:hypothetical protein [Amycolatopsis sp. WAC 04197]RSN39916.1 hypothetical protein DMC64_36965 [Amycolatopsis sp. WAC 04197]
MVQYDVAAMEAASKRIAALRDELDRARNLLGDGTGAISPFGGFGSGGGAHEAVTGFQAGVYGELGHAIEHLDRSAAKLRQTSRDAQGVDTDNARIVHHATGPSSAPASPADSARPATTEVGNAWLDEIR